MERQEIQKVLLEKYNKNSKQFSSNRILGTFYLGNLNYGFQDDGTSSFITIYLPTFQELCVGIQQFSNEIIDIRKLYHCMTDQACRLQILFSKIYYINPKYEKIFKEKILNNRQEISRYNPTQRLKKIYNRIKYCISKNNLFIAYLLYLSSKIYVESFLTEDCFEIKNEVYRNYLTQLKNKSITVNTQQLLIKMQEIIDAAAASSRENYNSYKLVKNGIVQLMTAALQNNITVQSFVDYLTETQKKAFEILKTYTTDGVVVISVSKISEETKISRPIWKNLFLKLEKNNIATVENQGVKGTLIKFKTSL